MKNIPLSFVLLLLITIAYAQIQLEAEDGQLNGTVVQNSIQGFSGSGYVTGFDVDDAVVTSVCAVLICFGPGRLRPQPTLIGRRCAFAEWPTAQWMPPPHRPGSR